MLVIALDLCIWYLLVIQLVTDHLNNQGRRETKIEELLNTDLQSALDFFIWITVYLVFVAPSVFVVKILVGGKR